MNRFLITHDRFGHRYLFARDGTWEWDLAEEPEYKHFKLMSRYGAEPVLEGICIRDYDLLLRIYSLYHEFRHTPPVLLRSV